MYLQRENVLKVVSIPLFDLAIFTRCEEVMCLWYKLNAHDTVSKHKYIDRQISGILQYTREF